MSKKDPEDDIHYDSNGEDLLERVAEQTGDALRLAYQDALQYGYGYIRVDENLLVEYISPEDFDDTLGAMRGQTKPNLN